MKIVRYGLKGKERPGVIDSDDNLRDLSSIVNDINAEVLSPEGQEKLKSINLSELALVDIAN